jgi:DNA polymerase III subunit gamma/tau
VTAPRPVVAAASVNGSNVELSPENWPHVAAQLGLQGPAKQLAAYSVLIAKQGGTVHLQLDPEGVTFHRPALQEKLTQALSTLCGEAIRLEITTSDTPLETPVRLQKLAADDRLQNARQSIEADPNIRAMRDIFGATVQPDSVRPTD